MKVEYKTFNNLNFEMLKYNNKIIVKDKNKKKYYEIDESDFEKSKYIRWEDYKSSINSKTFIVYITTFLLFLVLNIFFYILYKHSVDTNNFRIIIWFIIYTIINITIHESSHIFALRMFGRKIDKFGFKFNYIFPSFYVRMNDVHMLSRNEKIFVHSAGLYINMVINLICIYISYKLKNYNFLMVCQLFVFGILMNSVPILNSDGYKIMLSIFMYNEKKEKIYNSIMIKILSFINILIAFIYLIKLLISFF